MKKILIAEDEPNMRIGLKDNLEFEGYEVTLAEDGMEAYSNLRQNFYDLLILDVMMPKMSGFDVCKKIRAEGIKTPVIFLTAKGEEIDKILGLEIGADDYITKPFSLRELLARIKAILRRTEEAGTAAADEKNVSIGKLQINFKSYTATENGKPVQMTHREYEIIHLLWVNRNKTVSRDELLNKIWGYDENPSTRTVDNFIVKIRQKIETDANHPQIILTVHGIGYKMVIG